MLLQGARAEAAKKALALNLKLQTALRKELSVVDESLQRNREVCFCLGQKEGENTGLKRPQWGVCQANNG